MPAICQFFGIVIRMFFNDHAPPHFHAEYNAFKAVIRIETLEVVEDRLPPRARLLFVDHGAVAWPGDIDLAPDAMYAEIKRNGAWVLK
jgi:hypothetical protein